MTHEEYMAIQRVADNVYDTMMGMLFDETKVLKVHEGYYLWFHSMCSIGLDRGVDEMFIHYVLYVGYEKDDGEIILCKPVLEDVIDFGDEYAIRGLADYIVFKLIQY